MTTATVRLESNWAIIQHLTDTMRQAAAQENWNEVMTLAVTRHRSLEDHFNQFPVGPTTADFYRNRINEMLAVEQELQTLALNARRIAMGAFVTSSQNHRAVGAYLNTASGK